MRFFPLAAVTMLAIGCNGGKDSGEAIDDPVPAFGNGKIGSVTVTVIGTEDDGLNTPRDLDFNPDIPDELWVVNRTDDSTSIFRDIDGDQWSEHIIDPFALHFMEEVSSIAFGEVTWAESDYRTFGTCQESNNTYNGASRGNDFMGPSLWTADPDYYGITNPEAVDYLTDLFNSDYPVDLGSHLDMLHESPLCMGMAWDYDNVYWVFDGDDGTIVRYDFVEDHGIGYDDHSDGIISRYVDAEVTYVPDVPSHLILDPDSGLLYIADTGSNRITVLDTTTGEEGRGLREKEPGTDHHEVENADYSTFIDGDDIDGMDLPSGIALVDGLLLVTDNQNSTIFAFDLNGEEVARLETGLDTGALMGIEARGLDDIWITDAINDQVLRLQP